MATTEAVDVVIVGGGFAGLAAARSLADKGVNFVLLEASTDHLGGRAYSYPFAAGSALGYDHGAEYVGDLQNSILALINEMDPTALINGAKFRIPRPYEVIHVGGKRHCFAGTDAWMHVDGVPPDLNQTSYLGLALVLAEIWLLTTGVDVVEPWNSAPGVVALDAMTVDEWLDQVWFKWAVTDETRDLVRISVEALLSVEMSEISMLYFVWYVACNDGLLNEVNDNQGGPQQYWLRGGTSSLAAWFAKPVEASIRQGVCVTAIDSSGAAAVTVTTTGGTFTAGQVIVAMSPHTAGRIDFTPALSADRRALFSLPMGRTIKTQCTYKRPWWRDSQGKAYDGYVGGADYPVLWVMDNSPTQDDGPFVLMTFTVGAQVDKIPAGASDAYVTKIVTDALRYFFDDDRALPTSAEFVSIVIHRWIPGEQFVGGGPNSVFPRGVLTSPAGRLLNAPIAERVFFAGAENAMKLDPISKSRRWNLLETTNVPAYDATRSLLPTSKPPFHTQYSDLRASLGYMDGAIESGRYVANEVALLRGHPAAAAVTTPPASPIADPPAPSTHGLAALVDLARAVDAALAAAPPDALAARHDGTLLAGRSGVAYLLGVVEDAAVKAGLIADRADRVAAVVAVRDLLHSVMAPHARLGADPTSLAATELHQLGDLYALLASIHARFTALAPPR